MCCAGVTTKPCLRTTSTSGGALGGLDASWEPDKHAALADLTELPTAAISMCLEEVLPPCHPSLLQMFHKIRFSRVALSCAAICLYGAQRSEYARLTGVSCNSTQRAGVTCRDAWRGTCKTMLCCMVVSKLLLLYIVSCSGRCCAGPAINRPTVLMDAGHKCNCRHWWMPVTNTTAGAQGAANKYH